MVPGDPSQSDIFLRDRELGTTIRISTGVGGAQPNGASYEPSMSPFGGAIVFQTAATNLVAQDTNNAADIFRYRRAAGTLERVLLSSAEVPGNADSAGARISEDGRFVAFQSRASYLVSGDHNTYLDVFLRDRQAETTFLIDTSPSGMQGNDGSYGPAMSADACYIAFGSDATNLLPNDTNAQEDVYVSGGIPCAWRYLYLPVAIR